DAQAQLQDNCDDWDSSRFRDRRARAFWIIQGLVVRDLSGAALEFWVFFRRRVSHWASLNVFLPPWIPRPCFPTHGPWKHSATPPRTPLQRIDLFLGLLKRQPRALSAFQAVQNS